MPNTLKITLAPGAGTTPQDMAVVLRAAAKDINILGSGLWYLGYGQDIYVDASGGSAGKWKIDDLEQTQPLGSDEIESALSPQVHMIDITPLGLKTLEGRKRVTDATEKWNAAAHEVANLLTQLLEDHSATISEAAKVSKPVDDDLLAGLRDLREAISIRNEYQEAFLRSVAGAPPADRGGKDPIQAPAERTVVALPDGSQAISASRFIAECARIDTDPVGTAAEPQPVPEPNSPTLFRFGMVETKTQSVTYDVEADTEEAARVKALIGDTVDECDREEGEVIDRNITERIN